MYINTVVDDRLSLGKLEGVGDIRAKRLKESGILTIKDLVIHGAESIKEICNFTDLEQASKLVQNAIKQLEEMGELKTEMTGTELLEYRKEVAKYKTGSLLLDKLLGGGVESKSITEFYGEYGCGKTQICETILALSDVPVIFIDTENTFRAERVAQIGKENGKDINKLFENLHVHKVIDADHLMKIIQELSEKIMTTGAKIVIVDSIIKPFRQEFIGRAHLADRQGNLKVILKQLGNIAEHLDVAVIITNQVLSSPDPFHPGLIASGGHIIAHTVTYRVWFRKGRDSKRIARFVKSCMHPAGEAEFKLDTMGVTDLIKPKMATKIDEGTDEQQAE